MRKIDLLIGFFIGVLTTIIGTVLFLLLFTNFTKIEDIAIIRQEGILGKVITLGAILNIFIFFILLKNNKELMARGVVLATIILAILTVIL
ncbi:hypothetical protein [Flavobacterium sp.]|uniref:hypothetical protein n=1 Tax=Flavobacterium sp. TaxID=239 RepID=UPI003751D065